MYLPHLCPVKSEVKSRLLLLLYFVFNSGAIMSSYRGKKLVNLVLSRNMSGNDAAEVIPLNQKSSPASVSIQCNNLQIDHPAKVCILSDQKIIVPMPLDAIIPSQKHGELSEESRQPLLFSLKATTEQMNSEIAMPELPVLEEPAEPEELSEPFQHSSSSYEPSSEDSSDDSDNETLANVAMRIEAQTSSGEQKKKKKRKRKADRMNWHRSVVKKLRLSGRNYVNRSGKTVPDKKPKNVDCSKCRYKCGEHFSEADREVLCQEYYNLADDVHQKIHLTSLMRKVPVARKLNNPKSKNRQTSRVYYLKKSAAETHRVCLKFFCGTFSISHRVVENCANNMTETGLYTGRDKRIGVQPANVTPLESIQLVKKHIDSFPRIESHYCRRDSQKQYLSPDLNISIMYRFYKDYCVRKNVLAVSLFVYQKIFHEYEPRLDFYKPKKDQCSLCNSYNTAKEKGPLQEEYNSHKQREKESMQMKADDKKKSQAEKGKTFRSISFDLQAILSIPHAGDNLSEESFLEIDVRDKRKLGRKKKWESITLHKKYTSRLEVTQKKKKDLVYLLEKKIIPDDYENFIKGIPETIKPLVQNESDIELGD